MYLIDEERELHLDVMLAVGDTADAPDDVVPEARHFDEDQPLTDTVAIGPLDHQLREAILDAREPRGENYYPGFRQYGSLYGLIRRHAPRGDTRDHCDPDHELSRVAAILRLARPHAMSLGDAARIILQPDGRREISPARVEGPGSKAYVIDPSDRWIRDEDVSEARALLAALNNRILPQRMQWAMVAHELLHWEYHVEVRWLLLCTALEGMIHTDDRTLPSEMQNREQFVVRLRKLRDFVPPLDWTEIDLDTIYDHRNETMHGADVRAVWQCEPFPPLYKKTEAGLRTILTAAILNPEVAAIFGSDGAVRSMLGTMGRRRFK